MSEINFVPNMLSIDTGLFENPNMATYLYIRFEALHGGNRYRLGLR